MAAPIASVVRRIFCTNLAQKSTININLCYSYWPRICSCWYHGSSRLYKSSKGIRKLEKMLTKKKKKVYYDPMNVAQLGRLATGVSGGKTKMQREDSIRLRTYNKILFDNLTEMMTTNLVSDELEELQVTVIGVRVSGDMSACRVYWKATGSVEEDDRIEEILQRHKGPLRQALISHRVLGKIPPIFFMKDKASASISEIDRLLAIADFGPEEELTELSNVKLEEEIENPVNEGQMEFMQKTDRTSKGVVTPVAQPSLFGIDHDALNRMINSNIKKPHFGIEDVDDGNLDKRFDQFRAFMKKKKLSKVERKQVAFYQGELDSYRSSQVKDFKDVLLDEEITYDDYDQSTDEHSEELKLSDELKQDK